MATLYELTGSYHKLLELSEDTDPTLFADTMDSITDAIDDKAVGYTKVLKDMDQKISELEGRAEPFKNEAKRLSKQIKSIESNKKRLRNALRETMLETDTPSIDTQAGKVSLKNDKTRLVIDDKDQLPAYLYDPATKLNEDRLTKELEKGEKINGARLERKKILSIR